MQLCKNQESVRGGASPPSQLLIVASIAATGVVLFLYLIAFASIAGLPTKIRESAIFVGTIVVAPPFSVWIRRVVEGLSPEKGRTLDSINIWAATAALLGLATAATLLPVLGGGIEAWPSAAQCVIFAVLAAHLLILSYWISRNASPVRPSLAHSFEAPAFFTSYTIAAFLLFYVNPAGSLFSPFFNVFLHPPFNVPPRFFGALGFGIGVTVAAFATCAMENWLRKRNAGVLHVLQVAILIIAIPLLFLAFFDFSLNLEPLHYLTVAGPAFHTLHGGTPMVDVFSQYGPGPVAIALGALFVGPHTLGTIQIAVQISNLLFYALLLICLFRMTAWKMTAVLLGFVAIAAFLAGWDFGNGNVNVAPSILGLRYLPALCMVLAISCLRAPACLSIATALCSIMAGLWSIESLIGAVGIHLSFIVFTNLHGRTYRRLLTSALAALVPMLGSFLILSAITLLRAHSFPDYATYLKFLAVYNPVSSFWSHAANYEFLAWMTPLLFVFIVLYRSWSGIFVFSKNTLETLPEKLYWRFLPMAALVCFTSSYYVFRSYDYTLLTALLPFLALSIPAILELANSRLIASFSAKFLVTVSAFLCLSTLTFSWLALTRIDAPYSFYIQECRDRGRCSASALLERLRSSSTRQEILEITGNFLSDRWRDNAHMGEILQDSVKIIRHETPAPAITVLLGDISTELALMYTDRWQHWPISFVYTDALIPSLATRIVEAPVALNPGELIVVRRDKNALPPIEIGIFQRIRKEYALCLIASSSIYVEAYRTAAAGTQCPAS